MKKRQPITVLLLSAFAIILLFAMGCNKSSSESSTTVPAITTYPAVAYVTTTTAKVYALLTSYGGGVAPTANGVCWSATNQTPTIGDSKTTGPLDTVSLTNSLTGLTPNTTYYVRAYATNSVGTGYGSVVKFKTNSATFATTATVTTVAGTGTAGLTNGAGSASLFYNPQGVCFDASGNMYVADSYNNVIRKVTSAGVTSTFAGSGSIGYIDGTGTAASFYAPKSVAADASGNIYVADMGNNLIRKITSAGVVSTLAGSGSPAYADATGTAASFKAPAAITVNAQGIVYVADRGNNVIRKITAAGVVTTLAGSTGLSQIDANGTSAGFNAPSGIAVDAAGNVYVAETGNHAIRKITTAGDVTTIIGNSYLKTLTPSPTGIAVDTQGNLFITDAGGTVYEITAGNILLPLTGTLGTSGFANGTNTGALFNSPQALALDASGNIYVADAANNMIRKVVVVTTL